MLAVVDPPDAAARYTAAAEKPCGWVSCSKHTTPRRTGFRQPTSPGARAMTTHDRLGLLWRGEVWNPAQGSRLWRISGRPQWTKAPSIAVAMGRIAKALTFIRGS